MRHKKQIYSPNTLFEQLPLTHEVESNIATLRKTAKSIFLRNDRRLALIVGPCSLHNINSAMEYAHLLKDLSDKVQDRLFIVIRAYIEKPRTIVGWKGFLYDPHLNGSDDLMQGIKLSRQLFLEFARLSLPIATEFLNPLAASYFEDLVTWGFIGARTSTSQIHREYVSSVDIPVGFKNPVHGDLFTPIHSILSSRTQHSFLGINQEGKISTIHSKGNAFTHLVLRGSDYEPNCDQKSLIRAFDTQKKLGVFSPIMIDTAHGNSGKNYKNQEALLRSLVYSSLLENPNVLGIMMESFLEEGSQSFGSKISPRVSLTDPCIGWKKTEEIILECYKAIGDINEVLLPT
jgi:3-deoxy-7-phosphoheptulonate synthase